MSSLPRTTASDLLPAARALGPSLAERAERAEVDSALDAGMSRKCRNVSLKMLILTLRDPPGELQGTRNVVQA